MSTVKFSDAAGTTLDVLAVNGQPINFQSANRDSLEIQIDKSAVTVDALDALTGSAANTAKLTIINEDLQDVRDNYSLRVSLAIKPVMVTPATSTAAEVDEDRLVVTLAQLTYAEVQQAAQQAKIDALGQQVVALTLGGATA